MRTKKTHRKPTNELDDLDLDELTKLKTANLSSMVNAMRKAVVDENR